MKSKHRENNIMESEKDGKNWVSIQAKRREQHHKDNSFITKPSQQATHTTKMTYEHRLVTNMAGLVRET